jgi:hypothetical protein
MNEQELRIDREGSWYWEGQEMTRLDIVKMFAENLIKDADGGYQVIMDGQTHPVLVEDVPFVIREVEIEENDVTMILKDGRQLAMPDGEIVLKGDVPYLSLFQGLDAKFSRHAWRRFLDYINESEIGFKLFAGGRVWPLVTGEIP